MSNINNKGENNGFGRAGGSLATLLVHAGEKPDPITGAVAPVLVRSKTYRQKEFCVEAEYQYSRGKNPTRAILEEKLAILENGGDAGLHAAQAAVFSSGNAAVTMLLLTLNPGDHVIFCKEVYGGTYRLVEQVFKRFGITASYVDFSDADVKKEIQKHISERTKYIFVETVSNPSLHVVDLELVHEISTETGVPFVVDSTFSPPCATRPLEYGAEAVIQSLSKYCAGHNDVLAGAVITRNKELYEKMKFLQRTAGAILSPDECYRVIQGLKTLEMRWERVSDTAQKVAEYLAAHPRVSKVLYPGLPSHAGHKVAVKQIKGGFGGVVSFEVKVNEFDGDGQSDIEKDESRIKNEMKKFVEGVEQSGVIIYGESLASPESILAYPAWMSHRALPREERLALGISDSFFRFSVGFEDPKDIIDSLEDGLRADW